MPSTYTNQNGVELIATGEKSGTWGTLTNTNLKILDRATSGVGTIDLSGSGAAHTLTTTDGTLTDGQYKLLDLNGATEACTITISPNDHQKIYFCNNTSSFTCTMTQGSGGNVTIAAGESAIIYTDGAGAGAKVTDFTTLLPVADASIAAITSGTITGITDLAVADGGTGASTAADARTNLGLGTAATTASTAYATSTQGATADTALSNAATAQSGADLSLKIASNLSDINNAGTARTNLGLGTAATTASTAYATSTQGGTADSALQDIVDDTTPQLGGALDANGKSVLEAKCADVASASALPLLPDGNYGDVTGTTDITSMDSVGGGFRVIRYKGVLDIVHDNNFIVNLTGATITTAINDIAEWFEYATGKWVMVSYHRNSGTALAPGVEPDFTATYETAVGVNGAVIAAATEVKLTLTDLTTNDVGVTLVSSQLLGLGAGKWYFEWITDVVGFGVSNYQAQSWIKDITGTAYAVKGNTVVGAEGNGLPVYGSGVYTFSATSTIELQIYLDRTMTNGKGIAGSPISNIFTTLKAWKLS